MVVDDLDRHLPEAGGIERAAVPLGMYLAWCGSLHLVSAAFQEAHERALLRLRYRELTPAEFFTATTHGRIETADLNEEGRRFTGAYYERYHDDFRATFGEDVYSVPDDWAHYERIAAVLTGRLMEARGENKPDNGARHRWWQLWRR